MSAQGKRVRVLYLDLDGTVRWGKDELGRFVNMATDVRVFDEVPSLLRKYKRAGWRIVAVSNQGGVALGHMSFEQCAEAMLRTNQLCGGVFDKIAFCVHHPAASDPEMATCWCRKPRPGLVIEAAHDLGQRHPDEMYPPHLGLLVGDRLEDRQCAEGAGLPFMLARDWRAGTHLTELEAPARG